jgi:hypothetical protein
MTKHDQDETLKLAARVKDATPTGSRVSVRRVDDCTQIGVETPDGRTFGWDLYLEDLGAQMRGRVTDYLLGGIAMATAPA